MLRIGARLGYIRVSIFGFSHRKTQKCSPLKVPPASRQRRRAEYEKIYYTLYLFSKEEFNLSLQNFKLEEMISVVIPLYNEEENVAHLYERLVNASPLWEDDYELIFVDDGSYDSTLDQLTDLTKQNHRVKVVKLSRNFGHQAALSAGLKQVEGDVIAVMDGDLQDPPEELPRFLEKWREGYHVVYAIRTKRKENFIKKFCYKVFYRILGFVSDIDIPIDSGAFCLMDKKVVRVLNTEMLEVHRFIPGLRAYAGFKQIGVLSERHERKAGEVKYTFRKLIKYAIDGLLDFTTLPLRMATYMGFFIALTSFLIGIVILLNRVLNLRIMGYEPSDIPGFATLGVGLFFMSGLIMIMLGVIGEYVGRMYLEVKRRPVYVIDEVIQKKVAVTA